MDADGVLGAEAETATVSGTSTGADVETEASLSGNTLSVAALDPLVLASVGVGVTVGGAETFSITPFTSSCKDCPCKTFGVLDAITGMAPTSDAIAVHSGTFAQNRGGLSHC